MKMKEKKDQRTKELFECRYNGRDLIDSLSIHVCRYSISRSIFFFFFYTMIPHSNSWMHMSPRVSVTLRKLVINVCCREYYGRFDDSFPACPPSFSPPPFFFFQWRSAHAHQFRSLGQNQSTVAHRVEKRLSLNHSSRWERRPDGRDSNQRRLTGSSV